MQFQIAFIALLSSVVLAMAAPSPAASCADSDLGCELLNFVEAVVEESVTVSSTQPPFVTASAYSSDYPGGTSTVYVCVPSATATTTGSFSIISRSTEPSVSSSFSGSEPSATATIESSSIGRPTAIESSFPSQPTTIHSSFIGQPSFESSIFVTETSFIGQPWSSGSFATGTTYPNLTISSTYVGKPTGTISSTYVGEPTGTISSTYVGNSTVTSSIYGSFTEVAPSSSLVYGGGSVTTIFIDCGPTSVPFHTIVPVSSVFATVVTSVATHTPVTSYAVSTHAPVTSSYTVIKPVTTSVVTFAPTSSVIFAKDR